MQNKPNLLDAQMNVSSVKTMNYEQITMNNANKNKPNSKPKQTQSNPISNPAPECSSGGVGILDKEAELPGWSRRAARTQIR